MTDRCLKCGEASTDPDYCSECGAAMVQPITAAPPPVPAVAADTGADTCPVCGETRPGPHARYCDTCRYDFVSATPFSAKIAAAPAEAPPPAPAPPMPQQSEPDAPAPLPVTPRWELLAQVDESLRKPEDPVPTDHSERLFPLDVADHLIGRRSDSADIHPEVVIPDPGISRRHARILRQPDGGIALVDLGSMNGSRLNGATVEPNVIRPLAEGDQVTLGCWTRLVVRSR